VLCASRGRVCVVGSGGTHAHTVAGANNRHSKRTTKSPPESKKVRSYARASGKGRTLRKTPINKLQIFFRCKAVKQKKSKHARAKRAVACAVFFFVSAVCATWSEASTM